MENTKPTWQKIKKLPIFVVLATQWVLQTAEFQKQFIISIIIII